MRTKLHYVAFAILTVFSAQSQDTTSLRPICFPFWMVQEIAIDLEEKTRLQQQEALLELQLQQHRLLHAAHEEVAGRRELQVQLLEKNVLSLEQELKAVRPRNNSWTWLLRMIGAFSVGYLLGNL